MGWEYEYNEEYYDEEEDENKEIESNKTLPFASLMSDSDVSTPMRKRA